MFCDQSCWIDVKELKIFRIRIGLSHSVSLNLIDNILRSQSTQQMGDEGTSSSRMCCQKLPRNWRIEKMLQAGMRLPKTSKVGRIFCAECQESRTVILLSDEGRRVQEWDEYFEDSIFCDPDLFSSYDVLTFFIEFVFPRVRESRAALLECLEIHNRICVLGNVFACEHARPELDELHKDSKIGHISGDSEKELGTIRPETNSNDFGGFWN